MDYLKFSENKWSATETSIIKTEQHRQAILRCGLSGSKTYPANMYAVVELYLYMIELQIAVNEEDDGTDGFFYLSMTDIVDVLSLPSRKVAQPILNKLVECGAVEVEDKHCKNCLNRYRLSYIRYEEAMELGTRLYVEHMGDIEERRNKCKANRKAYKEWTVETPLKISNDMGLSFKVMFKEQEGDRLSREQLMLMKLLSNGYYLFNGAKLQWNQVMVNTFKKHFNAEWCFSNIGNPMETLKYFLATSVQIQHEMEEGILPKMKTVNRIIHGGIYLNDKRIVSDNAEGYRDAYIRLMAISYENIDENRSELEGMFSFNGINVMA